MTTTATAESPSELICTLSHDMSANFILLEHSFSHLKKALARLSGEDGSQQELDSRVAHVEACLDGSKQFLDDLARLARTGGVEMEPGPVSVAEVLRQVLFEQQELLARHNIEVDVRQSLPVLWCNEARVKQIVANLIRNAAYHGCDRRRGRIVVSAASPAQPEGQAAMAAFQVYDSGPGIERRFHDEIFRPGRRLAPERAERSDMGGSGMGLAIVRQIVDYYGGSVRVDPDCRVGTAIVVALPEAREEPDSADGETPHWKLGLDARHSQRQGSGHGRLSSSKRRRNRSH